MSHLSISDAIFNIAHSYRLAMRSSLKANEIGLNAMHVKCLSLINNSHTCTANDIVNLLARDKAQIARLIKEMMDNQWLTKTANPEDKRSQILSLTADGKKLAVLIAKTQNDVNQKMLRNLPVEDLATFTRIADALFNNLNDNEE
ncbi:MULTISPECIES: MarR family winged helix-turn-helix transcriptional regulator [unclassified Shewanella]|uniref:MarR family winged helix-turn-helix transcriptional regulator n=1 Tax=unclassified Shewanella TaxID=196818 RepID=UPI000C827698|nr:MULTISPECIES: MarR family winged helix-turn-helix transcriptional regulator [unclassified Shewanella]MDO6620620.1 MarR family winged helix-turn-helix transcriptional regulator [Shewanella sp. 6_MG-2023]MDO6638998.1 MarR family winged helix-turn-helix transcriptional regulator [Shewanella sp. 5_MG-2023]MDO6677019.1 MarR family winged helix-turn-helix transcriptional regulator [Shewanella sp. 4_MG-2023]MDO6774074.1 MarR family winged helix-turn-helix transcriptional regulator [Shewanella sp. 3